MTNEAPSPRPSGAQCPGKLRQLGGGPPRQLAADVCGKDGAILRHIACPPYVLQQPDGPGAAEEEAGTRGAASSDHRAAYSDGEEGSSARSWTPSRGSSLDTDTDTEPRSGRRGRYGGDGSVEEGEGLLMNLEDDGGSGDTAVTMATCSPNRKEEEEEEDEGGEGGAAQKSPKRMGVHHLHRKDSLTRAQEQGTLLD
ncbi:hypothetical protein INR49_007519 [Caranx melampygus]|nr:hypothetical protein INR49_007519 [Caranx melampygus]